MRDYNNQPSVSEKVSRRFFTSRLLGLGVLALGLPISAYSCNGSQSYDTAGPFASTQTLEGYEQANHIRQGQTDTLQVKDITMDTHQQDVMLRDDSQEPDNGNGNPADGYAAQGFRCDIETDEGNFVPGEVYVNNSLLIGDQTPPRGIVDLDVVYTMRKGQPGLVARVYDGFPTQQ